MAAMGSSSSLLRCACCRTRISCFLALSCLMLFFLLFQLDLIPKMDSAQIRDLQFQVSRYLRSTSGLSPLWSRRPSLRVAICIVGGARGFELTGPSIKKYLLGAVANADVYVHAPLDGDAYKLSLLRDVLNLVHVRIFAPETLPETRNFTETLTDLGSPRGFQGLLHNFNLVEGCIGMIKQHQLKHKLKYDWIVRTRLDGYWNGNLPPLEKMDPSVYTVAAGSQYDGLNDRLGIGNWETSEVGLSRLSLLPVLHAHGIRGLNSESAYMQQLRVKNVPYRQYEFPFCVLSRRNFGWPPGWRGLPVLSISSKGNLNGAYCRPCTPVSTGDAARSVLDGEQKTWAWPGNIEAPEFCNSTGNWEPHWEDIFDRVVGPDLAKVRVSIFNQNLTGCIKANEAFQKQVGVWDSPPPTVICERANFLTN